MRTLGSSKGVMEWQEVSYPLVADGTFLSERISTEAQYCLDNLTNSSGNSALQMVFGSNPADPFWCGGDDEDLTFSRETGFP